MIPSPERVRELLDICLNDAERYPSWYAPSELAAILAAWLRVGEQDNGVFGRTDQPEVMVYTARIDANNNGVHDRLSGYHQMVMFSDHQRALDKVIAEAKASPTPSADGHYVAKAGDNGCILCSATLGSVPIRIPIPVAPEPQVTHPDPVSEEPWDQ